MVCACLVVLVITLKTSIGTSNVSPMAFSTLVLNQIIRPQMSKGSTSSALQENTPDSSVEISIILIFMAEKFDSGELKCFPLDSEWGWSEGGGPFLHIFRVIKKNNKKKIKKILAKA
jgi:hypothetical protein